MTDGVFLDSSFLIALANPAEKNHVQAQAYFRHFIEQGILMFLSTIAAAEFYQKQQLPQSILDAMVIVPFNHDDAKHAADLDFKRFEQSGRVGARIALKDDFKILGQAKTSKFRHIITADDSTLARYCSSLRKSGDLDTSPIRLSDGFDRSFWDPARQRDFESKWE